MLETAHRLTHESLGFEIADVLTTRLTLRGSEYARKDQQVEFYQKILREVPPRCRTAHFVDSVEDPEVSSVKSGRGQGR